MSFIKQKKSVFGKFMKAIGEHKEFAVFTKLVPDGKRKLLPKFFMMVRGLKTPNKKK